MTNRKHLFTVCAQYLILSTGWWADRQYRARNVVKNISTDSVSFDLLFTPIQIPASHQVRQWGPAACCRYRSAHHQPYRPCCKIHKNELISFSANLIRSLQSNLNFMNFTLVLFIFMWIGTYLWAAAAPASAPTKKSDFFKVHNTCKHQNTILKDIWFVWTRLFCQLKKGHFTSKI